MVEAKTAEYITIDEAMLCTGLAEKTLKARLRGHVTMFGHGSWDRLEFFEFWREDDMMKRSKRNDSMRIQAQIIAKDLAQGVIS